MPSLDAPRSPSSIDRPQPLARAAGPRDRPHLVRPAPRRPPGRPPGADRRRERAGAQLRRAGRRRRARGGRRSRGAASAAATCSPCTCPTCPSSRSRSTRALRAGGVVTPASPLFTVDELADQLRRARAPRARHRRAARRDGRRGGRPAGVDEVLVLGEPARRGGGDRRPPRRPDPGDVALLLAVERDDRPAEARELTHRSLVANLVQMALPFPIAEGERRARPRAVLPQHGPVLRAAPRTGERRDRRLARPLRPRGDAARDGGAPREPGARGPAAAGRARAPSGRRVVRPLGAAR